MSRTRRTVAILMVLLAIPSLYWSVTMPFKGVKDLGWWLGWMSEGVLFVTCSVVAALVSWHGSRYWQLLQLTVVVFFTDIFASNFIQDVLIEPDHWSHFEIVLKEAMRRGFDEGLWLVWYLIVLPLALPALLIATVWLCLASLHSQPTSAEPNR